MPLFNIENQNGCKGRCIDACKKGYTFNHYDEAKDVIGSWFDDFGYVIFRDSKGQEHKILYHCHHGVIYSYEHYFTNIPKDWVRIKGTIDNSDEIKNKIANL